MDETNTDTLVTPPAERPRLPPADMPARDIARQTAEHELAERHGIERHGNELHGNERSGSERNGIFRSLVSDDGDIAGLVAYSIYKQNKLDWLGAFEAAKGRVPDDAELTSYIIGEGTPRRLATYRHLAEATLAGKGPNDSGSRAPRVLDTGSLSKSAIITYAAILVLLLIGFWLALHYTMSPR